MARRYGRLGDRGTCQMPKIANRLLDLGVSLRAANQTEGTARADGLANPPSRESAPVPFI